MWPNYELFISTMKTSCYKNIDFRQTTITVAPAVFTGGIIAHHPWHIAWADADTGLTPSLPKLPSGMVIATWKPGDTIPTPTHDPVGHADENPGASGGIWFCIVGIPIIVVGAITLIAWCMIFVVCPVYAVDSSASKCKGPEIT